MTFSRQKESQVPHPPAVSEGSISSVEVKRTKKLNYFSGKGKKEWHPTEELIVKKVNITENLKKLRKKPSSNLPSIISRANLNWNNSSPSSSLSHIFPLNEFDSEKCVTKYFYGNTSRALGLIASRVKPKFQRTPFKAIIHCNNEADRIEEDDLDSEEGERRREEDKEHEEDEEDKEYKEEVEEENKVKKDMMSMATDLIRHENYYS
ncbi:unnamed protein product [Mucor hiemalis]